MSVYGVHTMGNPSTINGVPVGGPGFWFVTVNRSRSDGLSGFVGRMIRGKVREAARSGLENALVSTKSRLETR